MVRFRSRFERNVFWVAFIVAGLLFINGFILGHDLYSLYGSLGNLDGKIPYGNQESSNNLEKYVIDPAYFTYTQALDKGSYGGGFFVEPSTQVSRIVKPSVVFGGNDLDADGKPYPVLYATANNQVSISLAQDLRGKRLSLNFYGYGANTKGAGSQDLLSVSTNCGSKGLFPNSAGNVEVISSFLDDKDYVVKLNGGLLCEGSLKPGEQLKLGLSENVPDAYPSLAVFDVKWLFPNLCAPSPGLDLAFEDFPSGKTVTLTGSTQRWPQGLCNELSPILINQSAGGVTRLPELLTLLATPPKDSKPYVVPSTCNANNDGGCILRLAYWIKKDPSIPSACVDPTLQRAFGLNQKACDDIINIRNFCTAGLIYNNECNIPTDVKAKYDCSGTLDLNGPVPNCYDSKTKSGVSAWCKPSLGGIDPLTGKCPDGKDPYTSFEAACKADGGNPEGDQCQHDIKVTFQDPKTGGEVGGGVYNPTTGFANYNGAVNTPVEVKSKCEGVNSKGACTNIVTEQELLPGYEVFLRNVYFGLKLKAWLLILSLLTMIVIIVRVW